MKARALIATWCVFLATLLVPATSEAADTVVDTQGVAMRAVLLDGDRIYALEANPAADGTSPVWSGTTDGLNPLTDTNGDPVVASRIDSAGGGVLAIYSSEAAAGAKYTLLRGSQVLARSGWGRVLAGGELWAADVGGELQYRMTSNGTSVSVPAGAKPSAISGTWLWSSTQGSTRVDGENLIDHSTRSVTLPAPHCSAMVQFVGGWDWDDCGADLPAHVVSNLMGSAGSLTLPAGTQSVHAEASLAPAGAQTQEVTWFSDSTVTTIDARSLYSSWDVAGRLIVWVDSSGAVKHRTVPPVPSPDLAAPTLSASDTESWQSGGWLVAHPTFVDPSTPDSPSSGISWYDIHAETDLGTFDVQSFEPYVSSPKFSTELKSMCISERAHDRAGNTSAWSPLVCHRLDPTPPELAFAPWHPLLEATNDPAKMRVRVPVSAADDLSGIEEVVLTQHIEDPMGVETPLPDLRLTGEGLRFFTQDVASGNQYCPNARAKNRAGGITSSNVQGCYAIPWDDAAFASVGAVTRVSRSESWGRRASRLTRRGRLVIQVPARATGLDVRLLIRGGAVWVRWPEIGKNYRLTPGSYNTEGVWLWAPAHGPLTGGKLVIQHIAGERRTLIDGLEFVSSPGNGDTYPTPVWCQMLMFQQPGC
mgnify:CR=1 FL=1